MADDFLLDDEGIDELLLPGEEATGEADAGPVGLFGVEYTGKPSVDSEAEFTEVLRQFKARDSRERARQEDADDSEYFAVVVFQDNAQREAFVAFVGEDGPDHQYVDGVRIAEKLGIPIPESRHVWSVAKVDGIIRDYAI